jgi:hypothetical protein
MFKKSLALVLLGFLVVGGATVAYGTFGGAGFLPSLATVAGMGEDDHDDKPGRHAGKRKDRHHDDD